MTYNTISHQHAWLHCCIQTHLLACVCSNSITTWLLPSDTSLKHYTTTVSWTRHVCLSSTKHLTHFKQQYQAPAVNATDIHSTGITVIFTTILISSAIQSHSEEKTPLQCVAGWLTVGISKDHTTCFLEVKQSLEDGGNMIIWNPIWHSTTSQMTQFGQFKFHTVILSY